MSTVVVRGNVNGGVQQPRRRRRQSLRRRANRVQPVVMVTAPGQPRRRRRRRGGNRRSRRTGVSRGRGSSETFVFTKDNLMGNSQGSFTFGPSLSDCPAFKDGILKAYHEYKITSILLQFVSEASSTSSGSIAYELDPHCKVSSLQSYVNKFQITKGGAKTYQARMINGVEWHDSSEDQCPILWKGNGKSSDTAGSFRVTIRVALQNPK
nr:major capsid protein [Potato leafroll virus]